MRGIFSSCIVVCGDRINHTYCGLDLHNQTTPDTSKNGTYSAHVFTDEAIRIINQQVFII